MDLIYLQRLGAALMYFSLKQYTLGKYFDIILILGDRDISNLRNGIRVTCSI